MKYSQKSGKTLVSLAMDKTSPKLEEISKEEDILELAKKELLRDIKCASIRAEQFGAHSWAKPQKYVPSKRFLRSMLMHSSRHNERKDNQLKEAQRSSHKMFSSSHKTSSSSHKTSSKYSVKKTKSKVIDEGRKRPKRSRWDADNSIPKAEESCCDEDKYLKETKLKRPK